MKEAYDYFKRRYIQIDYKGDLIKYKYDTIYKLKIYKNIYGIAPNDCNHEVMVRYYYGDVIQYCTKCIYWAKSNRTPIQKKKSAESLKIYDKLTIFEINELYKAYERLEQHKEETIETQGNNYGITRKEEEKTMEKPRKVYTHYKIDDTTKTIKADIMHLTKKDEKIIDKYVKYGYVVINSPVKEAKTVKEAIYTEKNIRAYLNAKNNSDILTEIETAIADQKDVYTKKGELKKKGFIAGIQIFRDKCDKEDFEKWVKESK